MSQTQARFLALWSRCGGSDANDVYAELAAHYAEPTRHYHTLHHVRRCMRDLDWARAAIPAPDAVELALWCHDVVYRPGAKDNERCSAEWFERRAAGGIAAAGHIAGMIEATTHLYAPTDLDTCFTVDIDLAVLGNDRVRFLRDEAHLRAERTDLDDIAYDTRERSFLSALLKRPRIYHTDIFRDRFEARARRNLTWRLSLPAVR
ncbi:hypothetical protein [Pandoraea terrae]|uniref:HD domain-containing protein n=1 Tax=Pandoraea terrae TaxID=1537710 RepID=UPI001CD1F488|nr:hypothetical protein [Pandoraea terrae]